MTRLIQFEQHGKRAIAFIKDGIAYEVQDIATVRDLALLAIKNATSIEKLLQAQGVCAEHDYANLLAEQCVLAPIDHPDAAHCLVSGTGLTHLGSASARDKMHQQAEANAPITDSLKIFQLGVKEGKPAPNNVGAQPEWFYKGDGSIVVKPNADLPMPDFALDGGEEPEIVALYVIGEDQKPYRVGYAVGNEFSDHVTEKQNYLYLAHSKLRFCSFGPELLLGELPEHLVGQSRIFRDNALIWEKEFLSGEQNMSHSIENLEYHHFKYQQFLRSGDVHVHFLGTATLSFSDGVRTEPGDVFEIEVPEFGEALRNTLVQVKFSLEIGSIKGL